MTTRAIKRGLAPITNENARLLILGTLPGDESLRQQRYYAHPRNQFWLIVPAVYGEPFCDTYADRIALLRRHDIAVWDVLQSAERIGSLDTAIQNAVLNDFGPFFGGHRHLERIAFNGQKAHALFQKYVAPELVASSRHFTGAVLPSTSPAYTLSIDDKACQWRAFLTGALQAS